MRCYTSGEDSRAADRRVMRGLWNALFYITKNGGFWRDLPKGFGDWKRVYNYFNRLKHRGVLEEVMDAVHTQARLQAGREASPGMGIIDSQSVKTRSFKKSGQGYDGGKKIAGRKRHIVVDTLGFPLAIAVYSATPHDSACAQTVLTGLKEKYPHLAKVLADGGYQGGVQRWFFRHTKGACALANVKPKPGTKGFRMLQWRWIVERSFAWLGNFRRLSKDYEITPSSAKAFIQIAFSRIMLRYCFT